MTAEESLARFKARIEEAFAIRVGPPEPFDEDAAYRAAGAAIVDTLTREPTIAATAVYNHERRTVTFVMPGYADEIEGTITFAGGPAASEEP